MIPSSGKLLSMMVVMPDSSGAFWFFIFSMFLTSSLIDADSRLKAMGLCSISSTMDKSIAVGLLNTLWSFL